MQDNFRSFVRSPETRYFTQYSSLISACQYALPFRKILQYVKADGSVLDWGCGNGHLTSYLLSNKIKTTAYGFSKEWIPKVILDDELLTFVRVDGKDPVHICFDDETFDAVVSLGVLEHVHETGGDQSSSLREIHRILKPGGSFLCFHFPYSGSWVEAALKMLNSCLKFNNHVHTRRFSRQDTQKLVSGANLRMRECGRYNFLPRGFSRGLPKALAESFTLAALFNGADSALAVLFPFLCTQSYFVASKPE
jgi:SAM-dependent methyltransferase